MSISREQLKSFVQRIDRLEEEKKEVMEQIKDVYAEAGHYGFDKATLRKVFRLSKMDHQKRQEQEELLDLYLSALGLLVESEGEEK